MREEEFLKLVNDFVRGQLCNSENYRYTCFSIRQEFNPRGRREIVIQYNPYKVENNEAKEVKKTSVRNCDVFPTRKDCDEAYAKYVKWHAIDNFNDNNLAAIPHLDYEDWCFAEYNPKFYDD